jgi:hypothetical protein
MESISYSIDSKKRHNLRTGIRIYLIVYNLLLITIGFLLISKKSVSFLPLALITMGFLFLVYGLVGKELFVTHNYLIMDSSTIKIKRSFELMIKIKLKLITYIKLIPSGLEITFNDYVKTYDLSWLTIEEFQMLKTKLEAYCAQNGIMIE